MTFYEEQARKYLDFCKWDVRGIAYWCNTKGFGLSEQKIIREEIKKLLEKIGRKE